MGNPSHRAEEYLQPAEQRKFRRDILVRLEDPRYDPVFQYAVETAPDRPVQDAIRDLLLQAISPSAMDGAIRAARMQAYAEARDRVTREVWGFLRQLARTLELEGTSESTASTPQQGNRIGEPDSFREAA